MGSADAKVIAKANKIVRDQGCKIVGALTASATEATLSVVTKGASVGADGGTWVFHGIVSKGSTLTAGALAVRAAASAGSSYGGLGPLKLQITTSNS